MLKPRHCAAQGLSQLRLAGSQGLPHGQPLPPCREAVDTHSPWNQALRSHLPDLYVSSLEHFLALEVPEGAWRYHWLDWWLKSVPLQGEAQVGA